MSHPVAEAPGFDENNFADILPERIVTGDIISAHLYDDTEASVPAEARISMGKFLTGTVIGLPEVTHDGFGKPQFAGGILLRTETDDVTRVLPPARFHETVASSYGPQVTPVRYRFGLIERPEL